MTSSGRKRKLHPFSSHIAGIIIFLSVIFPLSLCSPLYAQEAESGSHKEAPPFSLSTSDGKEISLPRSDANEPTILVFWAFWCDTWKTVVEGYEILASNMKSVPFKYYVVAIDSSMPEVITLEKKDGNLPFPVLVDKDGAVSSLYNIKAVPTFFVLDKKGRIVLRYEGYPGNAVLKKLIWKLRTEGG